MNQWFLFVRSIQYSSYAWKKRFNIQAKDDGKTKRLEHELFKIQVLIFSLLNSALDVLSYQNMSIYKLGEIFNDTVQKIAEDSVLSRRLEIIGQCD